MARKRSPARLVIALSVAAVLAVFLLYTSIAGGGTPSLQPEHARRPHRPCLARRRRRRAGARATHTRAGLHFRVKDISGKDGATTAVVYTGSVPDLFKVGSHIVVDGQLRNGTFVSVPGSLVTKCPSKYTPKKS